MLFSTKEGEKKCKPLRGLQNCCEKTWICVCVLRRVWWHRCVCAITWIMHGPLCSNIINWHMNAPGSTSLRRRPKLLFIPHWSRSKTISHIRMPKLIERRDAGDRALGTKAGLCRLFCLTGIIKYMKLKFLHGGSCWQGSRFAAARSDMARFFCASVCAVAVPGLFPHS